MERFAVTYRLRPGTTDAYIKAHNEIWPEMRDLLHRGGIRQMAIFLRGHTLFLYAEVDDRKAYQALKATDPVYKRWDAMITSLLERPFDGNEPGCFASMNEIWHIEP